MVKGAVPHTLFMDKESVSQTNKIVKQKHIDKIGITFYTGIMRTYEENVERIKKILQKVKIEDDNQVNLSDKQVETLAMLLTKKKRTEKSERAFIAGYIYSHGQIVDPYNWGDESSTIRGILKDYKHNINLRPIKGDIQYYYDKKNTMFLNWHNKNAVGMDVVAMELEQYGIYLKSENPADQFVEMQNLWKSTSPVYVKKRVTTEELKKVVAETIKKDRD